jgi:hypothetical protein
MVGKMKTFEGYSDEAIVEKRLRHFIHKYYRIKIFQGLVITLSVALLLLLLWMFFGNTLDDGAPVRKVILFGSFALLLISFLYFVGKPLAKMMGWIKGLNFKEASEIIRQKHHSIEDRIINVIELAREKTGKNNVLYDYAISQKAGNISGYNFDEAVSFRKLGVFLIRFSVLAALFTTVVLLWPDFAKRGVGQVWLGNQQMAALSKIKFEVLNDSLEVQSGQDFLLRFHVSSDIPLVSVNVVYGSMEVPALKNSGDYEYLFKAVNSNVNFRLKANGLVSGEFELKTLKKPEIGNLRLRLVAPGYADLDNRGVEGDGSAEVLAGTTVFWTVRTVNTDELSFSDANGSVELDGSKNNWTLERKVLSDLEYELVCKNDNGLITNYYYKISVIKDLYPTIEISENRDSSFTNDVFIQGVIQDDFGFSKLEVVVNKDGKEIVKDLNIKKSNIYEEFYYTIIPDSTNSFYFFRVYDNDYVNGPKFSESRKINVRTISRKEIEEINNQLVDSISTSMAEGMDAIELMEKKISELRMEQLVGDLKPWEMQEKIKELNQLKSDVVDFLNEISKANKEFTENEEMLNFDQELTEKAKQIQELMEGLMDEEMKELLKEFEELAKEFNATKAADLTEKMELNMEKLKEQMEMSLELFKKYDMEKDLMKQVDQLNQMADSLDNSMEEGKKTEENLKEEFKKWEEEYEKKLEQDKEFKKPMGLEDLKKERDEVRDAAEEMKESDSGNAGAQKKKKASSSLRKLASKMNDMLGKKGSGGESVDLEVLRQIRNSLNDFSIKQEELNTRIISANAVNPIFATVLREQKDLESKFLSVRDSLKSIGYKQPVVTRMIGTELFHVETSMKNLFESAGGNRANVVRIEQNKIMNEVNSMAVKLDELIRSLEDSKGQGQGEQGFTDKKKPKKGDQEGSEKLGESKSQQESLKEQLKNAIQKMKSGAGGKKERGELARMLGQREMMRKALEKMLQDGGIGTEARDKANEALNMMKEVEKDIIYNRLGDQTMDKDNLIHTKLLEAENAEKERENENRRESKEFKGSFDPVRQELGAEPVQNKSMEQMLKYNELKLKRFYQEKYEKYIESTKK